MKYYSVLIILVCIAHSPTTCLGSRNDSHSDTHACLNSKLQLRCLIQMDGIYHEGDPDNIAMDLKIRRARFSIDGNVSKSLSFRIQPQWSSGKCILLDSYITNRFTNHTSIKLGKMKTPLGLEMNQSAAKLWFPERGFTTCLVPNRDIGIQLKGKTDNSFFFYTVFIGVGTTDQGRPVKNSDDRLDSYCHLKVMPFVYSKCKDLQGLLLSIAANYGKELNQTSELKNFKMGNGITVGSFEQDVIADGKRWRINPQVTWQARNLYLWAESVYSVQDVRHVSRSLRIKNNALLLGASCISGRWSYSIRFSQLKLDKTAINQAFFNRETPSTTQNFGTSINFQYSPLARVQIALEQTQFSGVLTSHRSSITTLCMRFQIAI